MTLPGISRPDLSLADLSLPDFTLPDLTQPDHTLPDLTQPAMTRALARRLRRIQALAGRGGQVLWAGTLPLPPGLGPEAAALCVVIGPPGATWLAGTRLGAGLMQRARLSGGDRLEPLSLQGPGHGTEQTKAPAGLTLLWHDPCRDALCDLDAALSQHAALLRAHAEDGAGHVALGIRAWKRPALRQIFGRFGPVSFARDPARALDLARRTGRPLLVWGDRALPDRPGVTVRRVEDGFLRSRGLGADLVPPLSLIADDLGLPHDPTRESRLEQLIGAPLPPGARARAAALVARLIREDVSKYNLCAPLPDMPQDGRLRLLVPGQVADDAALRLGAGPVTDITGLLRAARAAHPDALIVYKPHPDVEAGLRPGTILPDPGLADVVARGAHPLRLIAACDAVWTLTSLLGFEALLRGKPVTCLGLPFYAGWGLTTDLCPAPARRRCGADLLQMVHAALIAYPRYIDPVSGLPCPPEVVLDRLAQGAGDRRGPGLRLLARAQRHLARNRWLWR